MPLELGPRAQLKLQGDGNRQHPGGHGSWAIKNQGILIISNQGLPSVPPPPPPPPPGCDKPIFSNLVKIAEITPDPDIRPGSQFERRVACYRCAFITVDSNGNISSSSYQSTTNNLNLTQVLINNNLVPTQAGDYLFYFIFYGWRRKAKYDQFGTLISPAGWISDDTKYDIWTDPSTAILIPGI